MVRGFKTIRSCVAAGAILVGSHASALSAQITDFVFMIDATSSMAGEIAGVRNGFSSFVGGLNAASVDARFAVVVFGGASELTLDFTSDTAATQAALNAVTIGASAGIQNNHNVNPEAGLETIRQVLGAAADSTLVANNIAADGNLHSRFRSGARKNLILVTDEDSDAAYRAANRFAGQPGFGGSDGFAGDSPAILTAGWQAEVDATAQAVIRAQAYVNMLVGLEGSSEQQYGDYRDDVSDADLLNFDGAATLANLLAGTDTDDSLQAQVLGAGLIARTFNVAGANDSDFVDNFFAAKLEEVITDPGVNIPEPGAVALFGLGLLGLGYARRRRSN